MEVNDKIEARIIAISYSTHQVFLSTVPTVMNLMGYRSPDIDRYKSDHFESHRLPQLRHAVRPECVPPHNPPHNKP